MTENKTRRPVSETRVANGDKHLEWVPIAQMRISPRAQRKHDGPSSRAKIENIANNYDPDKAGTPTVNLRDDIYWVIDGGHRYHAYVLMGWEDQYVQCWVYKGMSEAEEADTFLSLNDVKPVSGMDKFQRAIVAKREVECDIDRIVRAADLVVGVGKDSIGCVGAVRKTYENGGAKALSQTVRIIRDSYGMAGFSAKVTEGVGLFVMNYENTFDEQSVIDRLGKKKGGVNGLLNQAELTRKKYGVSLAVGVAASVVDTYNSARGGNKLNGWWSTFGGNHA